MSNKNSKNFIKIFVDLGIYPLEAIYGASFVFIDRAYVFLEDAGKNKVEVSFKSKGKMSANELEKLHGEFLNELLNYAFRTSLAMYNKKIRQHMVERALYSSVGIEDENWGNEDPLGIGTTWEEKNK